MNFVSFVENKARWWPPVYTVAAAGLLYAGFWGWAYDDPFITFRYAENLRRGLGFVYNPGEHVLSTTAPLFALLLSGLSYAWQDLPRLAVLVDAFSLAGGALCLWDLARTWQAPAVGWAALALYPTFPLLLTTLGSEMPFCLALCLGAFAAYARGRYGLAALCAGLAALARGDALIVAGLLAAHFAWAELRRGAAIPWRAVLLFMGLLAVWVAFATVYYGSPLPVTLAAKQRQGALAISQKFGPGLLTILRPYAARWYAWLEALLALAGTVYAAQSGRRWAVFLLWPLVYFAAYSALGVSRYPWYYAPLAPGFVAAAGLGLQALVRAAPARQGCRAGTVALLVAVAAGQGWGAARLAEYRDNRVAIYRAVGEWLVASTPAEASVGALEVGVMGYYSRRPMVDFAGLIQPDIAAQLTPAATYADSARWAIQTYRPDYVVLNPAQFPALLADEVTPNCRAAQTLDGAGYGYPGTLNVYRCDE